MSPIFLAILFSKYFMHSFHDTLSSNKTPRNFIVLTLSILWLFIFNVRRWEGMLYFLPDLWSNENYRPISILPNIPKVYERCLYDQISNFFEDVSSKYQCGFRKDYSAQHCLLAMIEKWKKVVDCGGVFGALLTDLSKVFDCIPHNLIIAKLKAYAFQTDALNLVYDYLSNRKQRVKINETFSSWKNIEYGVPKGSILGPLLFNIHLCDLFYFLEDLDIASYADDTTIYTKSLKKTKRLLLMH